MFKPKALRPHSKFSKHPDSETMFVFHCMLVGLAFVSSTRLCMLLLNDLTIEVSVKLSAFTEEALTKSLEKNNNIYGNNT